tara:strand:+ start:834 stop:998 length:165 start_codon:yes stop_codon:yes gene_type:complete
MFIRKAHKVAAEVVPSGDCLTGAEAKLGCSNGVLLERTWCDWGKFVARFGEWLQ